MKRTFNTDSLKIKKYTFFGICFLTKIWEYNFRETRLLGITISRKNNKQFIIKNSINFNNIFNKNIIKTNKTIDIIIPIYNGAEHLDPLLNSVISNTDLNYKLFLIDDKSTDSNVEQILKKWHDKFGNKAIIIHNEQNLGFVQTVNKALSYTTNDVVILNTDVRVPKNWASRLMQPIFENPNVASVTPFSNAATIFSFPKQWENNELEIPLQEIDDIFSKLNFDNNIIQQLQFPTGVGFCMAMSRKALNKIGVFDSVFGRGYGEENDWCMRAVKAGFINTLAYNLFVYHKHGGSFLTNEKKLLCENHNKIIKKRYTSYDKNIKLAASSYNYQSILFLLKLLYFNKIVNTTVLYVDHSLGGGTESYFLDQISTIKNQTLIIRMQYFHDYRKYVLSIIYKDTNVTLGGLLLNDLLMLLKELNFTEIIINNLVGYENTLEFLDIIKNLKNKNTILTMRGHDYQAICPFFTLLNYKKDFCNLPLPEKCKQCFLNNSFGTDKESEVILKSGATSITEWRAKWNDFLEKYLDELIVFSESGKNLFLKTYPCLKDKIKIIPHKILPLRKVNIKPSKKHTIGILGNIYSASKGLNILSEIIKLQKKYNISVILIGNTNKNIKIKKTGTYKREELPNLLEKYKIDIIFIPSVWPETFSYTTSEAMEMDIPVACFDLGAPAERVINYKKGLIIDKINAEYALQKILLFIKKQKKNL